MSLTANAAGLNGIFKDMTKPKPVPQQPAPQAPQVPKPPVKK